MWDKLDTLAAKVPELERLLSDPSVTGNQREMQRVTRVVTVIAVCAGCVFFVLAVTLAGVDLAESFIFGKVVGDFLIASALPSEDTAGDLAASIELAPAEPAGAALAVTLGSPERRVLVGVKTDLRRDMARDWRRPRYIYEAGRIRVGDFETDGDFVFGAASGGGLAYTIVNLTKAVYGRAVLVEAEPSTFGLAFDAAPDQGGIGKLRYWRDKVVVPDRRP